MSHADDSFRMTNKLGNFLPIFGLKELDTAIERCFDIKQVLKHTCDDIWLPYDHARYSSFVDPQYGLCLSRFKVKNLKKVSNR